MPFDKQEIALPIHFQNAQWAVTDFGLECKTTFYEIEGEGLLRQHDPDGCAIIEHMGDKTWVDVDLLAEALRAGIYHHHPKATIPFDIQQSVEREKASRAR
jgi:hypothetical protein